MRSRKHLTRLTIGVLAVSWLLGVAPSRQVSATPPGRGSHRKTSPDLDDSVTKGAERIPVIIQTPFAPSKGLLSAAGAAGGKLKKAFGQMDAIALELPARVAAALAARSDVKYVSLDRNTQLTGHLENTTGANLTRSYGTLSTGSITGSGIGIAVLDSGIFKTHHSFGSRVVASVDFTGELITEDPYGHGTHVASIAAGSSHISSGAYAGVAPGAKIINVRVLSSNGAGSSSATMAGIDWCIANKSLYNIRVINMSLGTVAVDSYLDDPLCMAVRRAVDAGMVVCVAAGNNGKDQNGSKVYGTIHSPGIEPSAITVGAANALGTDSRSDDGVASYSSRGPTRGYSIDVAGIRRYDNIIKPDLVAPGNKIIAAEAATNHLAELDPSLKTGNSGYTYHKMMRLSGTSMATPAVAGAAALVLQRNPALTPNLVKAVLEYTAQPLAGFNTLEQGAGLLNVEGAVRLAGLIRSDLNGLLVGDPLLVGAGPDQSSTIAGSTFLWGGGLIQKWNFITGSNLILKYQGIYGQGVVLTDGVVLADGTLLGDVTLLTDGTLLSDGVVLSDGTLLSSGTLLTSGTLLGDGVVLADGVVIADGVVLSDSTLALSMSEETANARALSDMSNGDSGGAMQPELDTSDGG